MKTFIMLMAMAAPAAAASSLPPERQAACAAEDMQLAYYWLDPVLDPAVKFRETSCHGRTGKLEMPEWLEKARPAMLEKKAWKDPEEGELSEARLWQSAFSILYELADKNKLTLSGPEGKAASPLAMAAEFGDIRLRLIMSIDRLYRAGFDRALEGRGGAVVAAMDRAVKFMDAVTGAIAKDDAQGASSALAGAMEASRAAFAALIGPAPAVKEFPRYDPEPRLLPGYRGVSLPLSGSQVMFLSQGDRVDMLVTFDAIMTGDRKEKVTATILQNVVVVKVDKPETSDGVGVVQLLCNPNEAQYAALSLVQGGSIALSRRARGDFELHPMEIASFRKLFK